MQSPAIEAGPSLALTRSRGFGYPTVMARPLRPGTLLKAALAVTLVSALILGVGIGVAIASTRNIANVEDFTDFNPALPTRLLDIKGRLITEFFSEEKREIVAIKELPQHLVDAFIVREDQDFWKHRGFSLRGIFRAAFGVITRRNLGGGSTITQQLAGTLYADRTDISLRRKIVELWWALQLERRFSKQEILEMYLNRMIMGPGVYGVEAASKFFFGHSAREVSVAEAAILVIQLSSPTRYNPFRNPTIARERSREILDQMILLGYVDREAADDAFASYWENFDYTRTATSAFYMRDDKAPWFSEYVRRQLEGMLYGSLDIYKDGFTVHTTLDLDYQAFADRSMARGIEQANKEYLASSGLRLKEAESTYVPIVEMLGLAFNLEPLFVSDSKVQNRAQEYYRSTLNPTIDSLALVFGIGDLRTATKASYDQVRLQMEKATVEGALITIENETGHVKAVVGGSKYDQSNQLIRATQSLLMPGSAFKPLYYSAAIDTRKFTEGSLIYDSPVVFYNDDGTPYIPLNYRGEWKGPVLTWVALAKSMNVPSVKVLDAIGFDAAINRAAALLDVTDPSEIRRTFPRLYPLALGVIGVSPLKMARAYSIFANQGREVTPVAIRSVEDRQGRVFLEPEKELRTQQKKKGSAIQLISPQNAYVMTDMLRRTVSDGTLQYPTAGGKLFTYKDEEGKKYTIPSAGKTGTTQNWADAWTVGFTPYMTTAVWFGFDRPGNSLGVTQSGAAIAGVLWANYTEAIHRGLPFKDFVRPQSGLVDVKVCAKSGLLPTDYCDEGLANLVYYEGTQPHQYCDLHQFSSQAADRGMQSLSRQGSVFGGLDVDTTLTLDLPGLDQLLKAPAPQPPSAPAPASSSPLPPSTPPPSTPPTEYTTPPVLE